MNTYSLLIDLEPLNAPNYYAQEEYGVEEHLQVETFQSYIGMEFSCQEEAYELYNAYGFVSGFSIRKCTGYKTAEGKITSLRLVCSKNGLKPSQKREMNQSTEINIVSNERTPQKQLSDKRCDCKAALQLRLHEDGKWRVSTFHKDHNHELVSNTPSKKRNLQSHKRFTLEERENIRILMEQNVGTTQIREFLAQKRGDRPSTQETDPGFFFSIEPDEDNAAKNIFWVDGRSRRAYQEFGDVVTFDTTYNTNKYSMPLAPFLGANRHRHTITFGCALIRDEKKTTFCWLLETWLKAMGGLPPKAIITDQCPSMRVAIEIVLPNTVHRSCQWHVLRKARDHLGVLYGSLKGFKDELVDVINLSLTVSDFEKNWEIVMKKYKLQNNPHLNLMFDTRNEWAPAYFRGTFFANMATSQRSENLNVVTKIWVCSNTSLYRFAFQFDKMVANIYEKESDEDIKTMNQVPHMWSWDPMEAEARKVYIRSNFLIFKEKLRRGTTYRVRELEKDNLYEVHPVRTRAKYEWHNPTRIVRVDRENARADCECKGFEFESIICSHAIEVMRYVGLVPFLPAHYILRRWCRDANVGIKKSTCKSSIEVGGGSNNMKSVWLVALTQKMQKVSIKAVETRVGYERAWAKIDELDEEVATINEEAGVGAVFNVTSTIEPPYEVQKSLKFNDPPVSQCKGKRLPKRLKPPADVKGAKKMRYCGYCHLKEGHNKATCPKKIEDAKKRIEAEN